MQTFLLVSMSPIWKRLTGGSLLSSSVSALASVASGFAAADVVGGFRLVAVAGRQRQRHGQRKKQDLRFVHAHKELRPGSGNGRKGGHAGPGGVVSGTGPRYRRACRRRGVEGHGRRGGQGHSAPCVRPVRGRLAADAAVSAATRAAWAVSASSSRPPMKPMFFMKCSSCAPRSAPCRVQNGCDISASTSISNAASAAVQRSFQPDRTSRPRISSSPLKISVPLAIAAPCEADSSASLPSPRTRWPSARVPAPCLRSGGWNA